MGRPGDLEMGRLIIRDKIKRLIYRLARTGLGAAVLSCVIRRASFAVPAQWLLETDTVLAFHHPAPSYPLHILILPKEGLASLADLPTADGAFEADLFRAVNQLVERFDLSAGSYRLIANGGQAQDVPLLHFHLIAEDIHIKQSS